MQNKILIIMILCLILTIGCQKTTEPLSEENISETEQIVQPTCPDNCDDGNPCTRDNCSEQTNYTCVHEKMLVCCGDGICEINRGENISSCNEDCKKLGELTQNRKKIDFFPKKIGQYELLPFEEKYFEEQQKHSYDSWIDHTYEYLKGAESYIIYQYILDNVSYYGTKSRIWETDNYHAQYSKRNKKGYTFNIYITRYYKKENYDIVEKEKSKSRQNFLTQYRNGKGIVEEFEEPLLKTKILVYSNWYYERKETYEHECTIFLPEINTVIEFDFTDHYINSAGYWDSFDSFIKYPEVIAIMNEYIMWLGDKRNTYSSIMDEEKLENYQQIYEATMESTIDPKSLVPEKNSSRTILYINEKDWKVMVNLDGFSDVYDDKYIYKRFLSQQRGSDHMTISIFAERIAFANSSSFCKAYYYSNAEAARKEAASEFKEIAKASELSEMQRNDKTILTYDLDFSVLGESMTVRVINAYFHHDGYCFDFHISKSQFEEKDMIKFYQILDSVQVIETGIPPSDDENVYSIPY